MAAKGFGQLVKEARELRGLTQVDLAERLNTSNTTVSNIEREETFPSPDQVNGLVVALGMSPELLLAAMGFQLTPPAAARLPRTLVQGLLEMTPEELAGLEYLVLRRVRPDHPTRAPRK